MKAIAAMAANRTIGKDGKLPWRIPGDLKFFKKMTDGCRCIVGRKTFDDLPTLPNREFIVFSRTGDYLNNPNLKNKVVGQWKEESGSYFPVYGPDTWVIGGATIYQKMLPLCTDLYLTRIFSKYEGDTFFPSFDGMFRQWDVIERTDEYAIVHYKNITPL